MSLCLNLALTRASTLYCTEPIVCSILWTRRTSWNKIFLRCSSCFMLVLKLQPIKKILSGNLVYWYGSIECLTNVTPCRKIPLNIWLQPWVLLFIYSRDKGFIQTFKTRKFTRNRRDRGCSFGQYIFCYDPCMIHGFYAMFQWNTT